VQARGGEGEEVEVLEEGGGLVWIVDGWEGGGEEDGGLCGGERG
jgi:hypothetical protein